MERTYSLTVNNITATQFVAIQKLLDTPETTVSPDESEEFGTKPMTADDLGEVETTKKRTKAKPKTKAAKEESEDNETEEAEDAEDFSSDDEEGETTALTFSELKRVVNAYGNQFPSIMRGILTRAGVKNTKELEAKPKLWAEVYEETTDRLKKYAKSQKTRKSAE